MNIDMQKAIAELDVLRGYVQFVNDQVGVYMDCLSGFEGNIARVHRQIARIQRRSGVQIKNGEPVMMYTSVEDPNSPEVIHHRIIRANDFEQANSEIGFNEQQVCWSIIVFLFTYWNDEVRPQIAEVRGIDQKEITVNAMGDLRILRNAIIHDKGILSATEHSKLKVIAPLFVPGKKIAPSHDEMHKLFVAVKQAIAEIMLHYTGHLPGAPKPSEIVGIAIQNGKKQ